jgi:hypothetical protein
MESTGGASLGGVAVGEAGDVGEGAGGGAGIGADGVVGAGVDLGLHAAIVSAASRPAANIRFIPWPLPCSVWLGFV